MIAESLKKKVIAKIEESVSKGNTQMETFEYLSHSFPQLPKHELARFISKHLGLLENPHMDQPQALLFSRMQKNRNLAKVNPRKYTKRFTLEEIQSAMQEYGGFCISCGAYASPVEPDARNYKCEDCGQHTVFGAEELVVMGLVSTSEQNPKANGSTALHEAHTKFNFKKPKSVRRENLPINEHDELFEVGMMPKIHYVSTKEGEEVEYHHKFKNDVRCYCSVDKRYLVIMRKDREPFDVSDWFYD